MIRIAVLLPVEFESSGGEFLADVAALEAAGAYAVCVEGSSPGACVVLGAIAAQTHVVKVGLVADDLLPADARDTLERISHGRTIAISSDEWGRIGVAGNRMAWKEALAAQEEAGVVGVIVPWDPRLIDLLRNPDGDDDRSDLAMSTG